MGHTIKAINSLGVFMLGPRFNVQGLAAVWTSEELKGIVSNLNLTIDDKFLQDQNLTKENVLAQVKIVLNTSERNIDFTKLDSSHPIMQKNVEQTKINFLIRANLFKTLEKEAIEHFLKILHNQELRAALHAYIAKISDANYQKMIAETEAQLLAEHERNYNNMILAELDRMNKEAEADWDAHKKHIEHLDNKINNLRQQRQEVWEKYEEQITKAVANFKTSDGKQPFSDLTQEQQRQLGKDYAIEGEKLEQIIVQLKHGISKDEERWKELDKEEKSLMKQMRAQEGPKIVAKQEQNKKDRLLTPQQNLESQLKLKIDNNERIQKIRIEKIKIQNGIEAKKEKISECENELENLLKTYLKKHYTPQQINEKYKENPNLENEFKKHMESNPDFMSYKMEIREVNKEVFDLKGQKETSSIKLKEIETKIEATNKACEDRFKVTPTPIPGGFLSKTKRQCKITLDMRVYTSIIPIKSID